MAKITCGKKFNNLDTMIDELKNEIDDADIHSSCDNTKEVETSEDIEDIENYSDVVNSADEGVDAQFETYMSTLENRIENDMSSTVDDISFDLTDTALIITAGVNDMSTNMVTDFHVPFADLKFDENLDAQYIEDAINDWVNEVIVR